MSVYYWPSSDKDLLVSIFGRCFPGAPMKSLLSYWITEQLTGNFAVWLIFVHVVTCFAAPLFAAHPGSSLFSYTLLEVFCMMDELHSKLEGYKTFFGKFQNKEKICVRFWLSPQHSTYSSCLCFLPGVYFIWQQAAVAHRNIEWMKYEGDVWLRWILVVLHLFMRWSNISTWLCFLHNRPTYPGVQLNTWVN